MKIAVLDDRPHLSTIIEHVPNFGSSLNSPKNKIIIRTVEEIKY